MLRRRTQLWPIGQGCGSCCPNVASCSNRERQRRAYCPLRRNLSDAYVSGHRPGPGGFAVDRAWRTGGGPVQRAGAGDARCAAPDWPVKAVRPAMLNMVLSARGSHVGLMRGAGQLLPAGHLSSFTARTGAPAYRRHRNEVSMHVEGANADWGLRDLEHVEAEAEAHGLRFECVYEMPANNIIASSGGIRDRHCSGRRPCGARFRRARAKLGNDALRRVF